MSKYVGAFFILIMTIAAAGQVKQQPQQRQPNQIDTSQFNITASRLNSEMTSSDANLFNQRRLKSTNRGLETLNKGQETFPPNTTSPLPNSN